MVYPFWKIFVWWWYKLWIRKIEGIENIPKNTAFIVAVNHSSYYDFVLPPAIIGLELNKLLHALVNSRFWKNPIARLILECGECIPVFVGKEKGSKKRNQKSFEQALNYLKKGEIVEIFPEGRRSIDGKLGKAYNGVARLALKAKVPVLPVGIIDSHKILPKGKIFPRFVRCEVKIGKPIYFDKYYGKKPSNKIFEEVTRSVMKEIAGLISQKYDY